MRKLVFGLLALTFASALAAQEPKCPADAEPVPAELSGWADRTPVQASADAAGTGAGTLVSGQAHLLRLLPVADVRFPAKTKEDAKPIGYGGNAALEISRAGTYHVALGWGAWIDVVRDGKPLESIAHGHGPACSGIRKIVDFALQPGRYLVSIDGNEAPEVSILVAAKP